MTTIRTGDRVRVTGIRGTVIATVEEVSKPRDLPELPVPDAPAAAEVAAIFDEANVDLVAILSYPCAGSAKRLMFAAIHTRGDGWHDLQGQELQIAEASV